MGKPAFRAEVGFGSGATDAVVRWTDVTAWFQSMGSRRGRSTELDQIETGTATITFDNADGRFTPGRVTVNALAEQFNALGVVGQDFATFDSGEWLRSGSRVVNLVTAAEGVTVSSSGAGPADFVALRLNSVGVPVTPGTVATVRVRARVTDAAGIGRFRISVTYDNGATRDVTSQVGAYVASNGALVSATQTFTVPAGVTHLRPKVDATPDPGTLTAGTLALTADWVKVDLPNPFAGKLDARNPVRTYSVFDDNWLPQSSANASHVDPDQPRWMGRDATGGVLAVKPVFDSGLSRDVFDMASPGAGVSTFDSGIPGDADVIHVRTGDTVTLDADLKASGVVSLQTLFTAYGTSTVTAVSTVAGTGGSVWQHRSTSWTATGDGYVRLRLSRPGPGTLRAANLKVRLNGAGTATVAVLSGIAPAFRGFVEKWSARQVGLLGITEATCVDTLTVLNQPLDTIQRVLTKQILTTGQVAPTYYWPSVESDTTATLTRPVLGDYARTLRVIRSVDPPEVGGFTTNKTMIYSDGEQSGGFTVADTDPAKGAVLSLSEGEYNVLSRSRWSITMWVKIDEFPPPGEGSRLVYVAVPNGVGVLSVDITPDGRLYGQIHLEDGTPVATDNTTAGAIKAGKTQFVYIAYDNVTPGGGIATLDMRVDGVSKTVVTPVPYTVPDVIRVQFGGINRGSVSSQFYVRGTINHVTLVNGAPPDNTYMDRLRAINLDSQSVDSGLVQDEVARINTILSCVGVPYTGSLDLDPARSQLIAPRWQAGSSAYDLLQTTADSAGGAWLCGPSGELAYQNRSRRAASPIQWTLREHFDGAAWELDESRIANSVTAQRSTGAQRTASDAPSILRYGVKAATLTRDVVSDDELVDAAADYIRRYKTGVSRCETVVIDATTGDPATDPDLMGLAHAGNVGDRLLLSDLPSMAPSDEVDVFIEGVALDVKLEGSVLCWVATFNVSSAPNISAWVLEDVVSGVLDSPLCVVAY